MHTSATPSHYAHPSQTAASKNIKHNNGNYTAPRELWILVGSLLALPIVHHLLRLLVASLRRRRRRQAALRPSHREKPIQQPEETLAAAYGSALDRGCATLASAFDLLLGTSVPVSFDRCRRIFTAELFFSAVWLIGCLTWTFARAGSSYSNRSGIVAVSQAILVVGLAGKNNVISFLTGIGPEKLNTLHRAAGRTLLLLLAIHSFAWIHLGLRGSNSIHHPRIIWGVVSFIALVLLTLLSVRWLRNKAYEVFLACHLVLVFVFLLGAILHAPGYGYWVYPAFGLWGLDRLLRLARIIWYNTLWRSMLPRTGNPGTRATLSAMDGCTVKISLNRRMTWKPGQYAYLSFHGIGFPGESHPFTIASAPFRPHDHPGKTKSNELLFLLRVRDGITRRLLAHAMRSGGTRELTALVGGPYGCPPDLTQYATCLLICGGTGISYGLAQLEGLVRNFLPSHSVARRVCLLWVVKRSQDVEWIQDKLVPLLDTAGPSLEVDVRVFVTRPSTSSSPPVLPELRDLEAPSLTEISRPASLLSTAAPTLNVPSSIASGSTATLVSSAQPLTILPHHQHLLHPRAQFHSGRPDIHTFLNDELVAARLRGEHVVSVDVCGPAGLARDVRHAVREVSSLGKVWKDGVSVELHVELFGW